MSILLRSLCKIPRDLAVYNNSRKSLLQSTVRWNTSAANAFKAHRAQAKTKKEPVEIYKWILLVRLLTNNSLLIMFKFSTALVMAIYISVEMYVHWGDLMKNQVISALKQKACLKDLIM